VPAGKVNCSTVPWGTPLVADSLPPCAWMIARRIDRPIPNPSALRAEERVENAFKIRGVQVGTTILHGDEHAARPGFGGADQQDEGLLLHDLADRDVGAVRHVDAVDDAVVQILRESADHSYIYMSDIVTTLNGSEGSGRTLCGERRSYRDVSSMPGGSG
jgi:hypothetical protein